MDDPLLALMLALLVLAIASGLVWPRGGLIGRIRRQRRLSTRILTEDALKHLYKTETHGQQPALHAIAGTLNISQDRASALLGDMEKRRLLEWEDDTLRLTPAGRDYALHVLRAHRLWERHLADETGFRKTEWHERAEEREHTLTPEDLQALSERLGHPTLDPHGDPIPGVNGEMIPQQRQALSALAPGEKGRIVHIEDEPLAVYAQLAAEGLAPGMDVHVLEKTTGRIRFWADGDEHVLAPLLAGNVSVDVRAAGVVEAAEPGERLSALEPGEKAEVVRIGRSFHSSERRRLMDLGFVPGTIVEAAFKSPGGDPVAYMVRGALIALRSEQSDLIFIGRLEDPSGDKTEQQHEENAYDAS